MNGIMQGALSTLKKQIRVNVNMGRVFSCIVSQNGDVTACSVYIPRPRFFSIAGAFFFCFLGRIRI